jgi:hypothetical protein
MNITFTRAALIFSVFSFCFFAVKMKENEILLVVEICVEGITTMMVMMMMMMMMVVVVVRYRED